MVNGNLPYGSSSTPQLALTLFTLCSVMKSYCIIFKYHLRIIQILLSATYVSIITLGDETILLPDYYLLEKTFE